MADSRLNPHPIRLAVVLSHPIQYFSPWFRELSAEPSLLLKVFYLWDFGITSQHDPGFGQHVQWDLPLLEGYSSCLIPNRSPDPGTHHFSGLDNPGLVPALQTWQPDVLLLFGYAYSTYLRLLLDPRLRRLPILLRGDSHLLAQRFGLRSKAGTLLRRMLFRRFGGGLPVGQANAAWMAYSGIPFKRQHLAPHAVDNARFQAAAPTAEVAARAWRDELGIPCHALVVLFAGKFEIKKRPLDLLAAFIALEHPSAVLVYVGAGPLGAELRQRTDALPPGRVILQGFQNQNAMPRTYALADLVVLPSFGAGETWGLCINEAMNLARPVLVSSHVGCGPDLVIHGKTGWIFPAGDLGALQAALAEALRDRQRLKAMGQAAREWIDHFSYAAATAGLLRALNSVVKPV